MRYNSPENMVRLFISTAFFKTTLQCNFGVFVVGTLQICYPFEPQGCDLQRRTDYEAIINYILDISEYSSFSWFQWCYFYN